MKKKILLSVVLFLGLFVSCKNDVETSPNKEAPKPKIKNESLLNYDYELVMASISKMKMNPNKSEGYFVSWTPKRIGKLNYIIYLDSKNELNESNRTNNVIKGQVEVK